MFRFIAAGIFALSIVSKGAGADSAQSPCDHLSSYQNIVDCALERHPSVQRANALARAAEGLEDVASQRPNPELDSRSVFAGGEGRSGSTIEVNLAHTFELGGKRGARVDKARSQRELLSTATLNAKETVYASTLLTLYRYRQLKEESGILVEALATFAKLLRSYAARPALGPEQRVSRRVFELAQAESELKLAGAQGELEATRRSLAAAVGQDLELRGSLLPPRRETWPEVPAMSDPAGTGGSEIRLAQGELRAAQAELQLARADSWPNLKIGPSFERDSADGGATHAWGFNVSLPLPIFQANGAGRAQAHREVTRAEQSLSLTAAVTVTEHESIRARYGVLVRSLRSSLERKDLERAHERMDALFQRGVVPSSLVIESHRQILELARTYNEQELQALEALIKTRALEGRLLKESL